MPWNWCRNGIVYWPVKSKDLRRQGYLDTTPNYDNPNEWGQCTLKSIKGNLVSMKCSILYNCVHSTGHFNTYVDAAAFANTLEPLDTADEDNNTIHLSSRRTAIRNINVSSNTNQYESLMAEAINQNSTARSQQSFSGATNNHSLNVPTTSMTQSNQQTPLCNQLNLNMSSLPMQSSDVEHLNQQNLIESFSSIDVDMTSIFAANNVINILSDDLQSPSNEPKETLTLPGLTELNAFLKENNAATKRE